MLLDDHSYIYLKENDLKNYFRGVYGKNISDYLRDLRMSTAERLLSETKLPISEIANLVKVLQYGLNSG